MAKAKPTVAAEPTEILEDLVEVSTEAGAEYTDVSGKDSLPEGVSDPEDEEGDGAPVIAAKKDAKEAKPVADDIPDDLKGKTPSQLAKMYRDAQQVIGRQGSELGDLRRTADTYIKAHLRASSPKVAAAPVVAVKPPDAVDFFTNPTDAVKRLIEDHPALKLLQGSAKEQAARDIQRQRGESERSFNTSHPDSAEVLANEEFRDWILKSPIRKALLLRAHQQYDLDAANEVFNTWKELVAARAAKEPVVPAKPAPKTVAKKEAARVPSGGNATPQEAGGGQAGKIYRRADVIRLMERDPDRYALMADEIGQAYAEGRVR